MKKYLSLKLKWFNGDVVFKFNKSENPKPLPDTPKRIPDIPKPEDVRFKITDGDSGSSFSNNNDINCFIKHPAGAPIPKGYFLD